MSTLFRIPCLSGLVILFVAFQPSLAQDLSALSGTLEPSNVRFETKQLAPRVYGLINQADFSDNSGFVVGERGVLVIDSHIHAIAARRILDAVRDVTDKPILYLVNTSHNGDHWFGNYAFPPETKIIAHKQSVDLMTTKFEQLRENVSEPFVSDPAILKEVQPRIPDVVLDGARMDVDLGGIIAEIHHFGYGNSPGDVVVYVPEAKVAWTGNFIIGSGMVPLLVGKARIPNYIKAITRFAETVDAEAIIPGHAGVTSERATVPLYLSYLSELEQVVGQAIREGRSLEETLGSYTLAFKNKYASKEYAAFSDIFHFVNVRNVYTLLANENPEASSEE